MNSIIKYKNINYDYTYENKKIMRTLDKSLDNLEEIRTKCLEHWVKKNRPSKLTSSSGIGWIYMSNMNRKNKDEHEQVNDHDRDAHQTWSEISKENLSKEDLVNRIIEIAKQYEIRSGKWMIFPGSSDVNEIWLKITKGVHSGSKKWPQFMPSVKVSPIDDVKMRPHHVICVYNYDFTDYDQIKESLKSIRDLNINSHLFYKPDIFRILDIYKDNEWNISPILYTSYENNKIITTNK